MRNKNYQIALQKEQLNTGSKITRERANHYIQTWKDRCYCLDIPDQVEKKLMQSMRVPSYQAIALSILSGDFMLYKCGFSKKEFYIKKESKQLSMF